MSRGVKGDPGYVRFGIYLDEVDVLFETTASESLAEKSNGFLVVLTDLCRLDRHLFSGFHVAEEHRDVGEAKSAFGFRFEDVEYEHFVATVTKVSEGAE